jgi:prepilin-type N-terminal cleavage/methylation domain-containing protein
MKNSTIKIRFKGFTLIEIIMVIVIIAILTVAVIPSMTQVMNGVKVKGAARKLVEDIRYAQGMAMSKHTNTTIVFNVINATCSGYSLFNNDTGARLLDPFTLGNAKMVFGSGNQFEGVYIESAGVQFSGTNTLRFDYQGNPQNGAAAALSGNSTINFDCGDETSKVTVVAGTGQALAY